MYDISEVGVDEVTNSVHSFVGFTVLRGVEGAEFSCVFVFYFSPCSMSYVRNMVCVNRLWNECNIQFYLYSLIISIKWLFSRFGSFANWHCFISANKCIV